MPPVIGPEPARLLRAARRCGLVLWLASLALACAPVRGGWDLAALERRHPELSGLAGHRLGDLTPHFLPDRDGAALFLCRWSVTAPIRVSLPADASQSERGAIRLALAAWVDSGLGVAFAEVEPSLAQIEIRFADPGREGWAPVGTGDTVADCAISDDFEAATEPERVAADMSFASVYLRRSNPDMLGREVPLSDDELVGAALHELGHALGFAGHAGLGSSVMLAAPEEVRRFGRRVNRDEPFSDATLSALYAVPSGVVVGHIELPAEQTDLLRRMARLARESGWRGPYARVGESSARILWRNDRGSPVALTVKRWGEVLGEQGAVVLEPSPLARRLLGSE